MKRVHILAEGQTEESFINNILQPHLATYSIHLTPIIVQTKRIISGPKSKGGINKYHPFKKDIQRLLHDTNVVRVTTMIDFYGLRDDFPGYTTRPHHSKYDMVTHVERALANDINHPRFLPFIALHEFEALLFSQTSEIARTFPHLKIAQPLERIRKKFRTPEEINDNPTTNPASRIKELVPEYQKPAHGTLIVERIGLSRIRQECPHFNEWLTQLENL